MATALSDQAARKQIRAALKAIDAAHKVLRSTSSDVVGNDFRVKMAQRLEIQERTNRGLMYRVFGEIADPPDGLGATRETRAALWERLHVPPGEIGRRFRLAARIRPRRSLTGAAIEPELPALAAAVESGKVGEDHIKVICRAIDVLPASVAPAKITAAERSLVSYARTLDAVCVTRLGEAIADDLNPDGTFTDADRARRRSLHLYRQGPDGMSKLSGLLDPQTRAYLEAITAAVRPGRHHPDDPAPVVGADLRSADQRAHDALKMALQAAIGSGKLGTHRGHPVTVIVTTTLTDLNAAAQHAGDPHAPMPAPARTGGGSRLPMRDLIKMAGGAIHYLAVFDGHTQRPLYLGRQKRVATADQRLICYARDRGCTRPNCTRPGYDCEVHHTPGWANSGRTNADKLHFGCPPDHAEATDGNQQTVLTPTGRLAWTDGTHPPKINHAHHPDELLRGDPDPPDAG